MNVRLRSTVIRIHLPPQLLQYLQSLTDMSNPPIPGASQALGSYPIGRWTVKCRGGEVTDLIPAQPKFMLPCEPMRVVRTPNDMTTGAGQESSDASRMLQNE